MLQALLGEGPTASLAEKAREVMRVRRRGGEGQAGSVGAPPPAAVAAASALTSAAAAAAPEAAVTRGKVTVLVSGQQRRRRLRLLLGDEAQPKLHVYGGAPAGEHGLGLQETDSWLEGATAWAGENQRRRSSVVRGRGLSLISWLFGSKGGERKERNGTEGGEQHVGEQGLGGKDHSVGAGGGGSGEDAQVKRPGSPIQVENPLWLQFDVAIHLRTGDR